jgi:NAD-reducing hydrogenase small subunit
MTRVRAWHEVVPVDIFLPGCPPDADAIFYVLSELAQGRIPELKDDNLHWH